VGGSESIPAAIGTAAAAFRIPGLPASALLLAAIPYAVTGYVKARQAGPRPVRKIRPSVGRTAGIRLMSGIQMEHSAALADRQPIPERALHGDRDDPLTFTAAPISRQLTRPYSRSMTDEAPPPQRGAELASQAGLRASHVDRDRAVELLRVAAGDGRLTAEELDARLEAALTARTCGELAALTTDLPAMPDSAPGAPVPEPKDLARIDCRGSSVKRDGRWLVPRRMEVRVTGGSVTLDFTEAVIVQPSLLIDADVSASRLTLVTKPGVVVDTEEVAAEGSYVKVRAHGGPEVPVILRIQVSGKVSGGHITARPPRRTFWPWLRRHPRPHGPASP
jgi:hypothetical protein